MPEPLASLISAPVLLFLVFGLGALATGVTMVLYPNPIRSALFLVLNMFCLACLYLLLNAYFLAVVQVIVYAGAIMVLFLFVIMLLNLGTPDKTLDRLKWQQPVAIGVGLVLAALFAITIGGSVPGPEALAPGVTGDAMGSVAGVGRILYDPVQPYLFPFEMTSVLLLVATVGSVVLAKRRTAQETLDGRTAMVEEIK